MKIAIDFSLNFLHFFTRGKKKVIVSHNKMNNSSKKI